MCLLTAHVRSFGQLFAVRLGLGIGESGAAPTSYALIHSGFDDRRRPIAYALFSAGSTIGIGTGVAVGSWLGAAYGWRHTMTVMAVPGLLLALVIALTLREPARDRSATSESLASPFAILREIAGDRLRCALIGAYGFASFAYAGFAQWAPTFYMRVHGLSLREVGATYSLSSSAGALLGLMLGGIFIGPLQRRRLTLSLGLCGALAIAAAAASAGAFLVASSTLSLWLFAGFGLAAGATYAPTIALFQERSPAGTRAFAAAAMLLVSIIIGQGGGPFFVGMMSDLLRTKGLEQPLSVALALVAISLLVSAACQFTALRAARRETKP
jgi:predicted MFS family arabinose efflux permease